MDRLGLGGGEMTTANPGLIYCSIPGFAHDDPRAAMPAWEGVVGAATDTYRPPRGNPSGDPAFTAVPIASTFAAFQSAVAIAYALYARQRGGGGQHIEVPMFDAMFAAIGANGLLVDGKSGGGRPDDFWGGIFQCSDGRYVQFQLATPRFRERFVAAVRRTDWEPDPAVLGRDPERWKRQAVEVAAEFKTRTADEWEELGARADVPLIKVRSSLEWINHPHARETGAVVPVQDPSYGQMWQAGSPLRMRGSSTGFPRAAHPLDADRDAILAGLEAGHPAERADGAPNPGGLLAGVRVVDVSQVLAGPTAGRTLAEFGADVIKVNNPNEQGAGYTTNVHRYHTDTNRGKRSILLDLQTDEGKDVFWKLAKDADVVIHNFRDGVPERLGISYEQALARGANPVYVSITAYGRPGPWATRPGYEPFGQAPTGLSERAGGDGPPGGQPFAVNDYGTGLLGAFAAGLALFHRERSGQGQQVEVSLAQTGTILQSPFMQDFDGKTWDEPRGPGAKGTGPLQRLYRAEDGWFFLGARDDQRQAIAAIPGLEGAEHLEGDDLAAELGRRFATKPVDHWTAQLVTAGAGAHRLVSVAELMADPWVVEHGLSVTRIHDFGAPVTTIGPAPRLSRSPVVPGRPAPTPGADSRVLLASIGMADRADEFVSRGIVAERPRQDALPV
jgi:crotonobetainyl-CoA:carnitine CoA-transferase CaiB-like acyl-CoA transferase